MTTPTPDPDATQPMPDAGDWNPDGDADTTVAGVETDTTDGDAGDAQEVAADDDAAEDATP